MKLKLRQLLTKRTLHHSYVTSSSPFIFPLSHLQNPNLNPKPQFPPLFSKPYHSSPFLNFSSSQSAIVTPNEYLDPHSAARNEFLARFANPMRLKLREIYKYCNDEKINDILEIIVGRIVEQFEKGEKLEDFNTKRANFWDELWRDAIEVSKRVYVEMEGEKTKEKMEKFLQCDQVKEMARFANEVGVRGDLLHELRFEWARAAMEESELYNRLESSCGDDESEKGVTRNVGLVKRYEKIKYMIYGLDLSDFKWLEMADKVHDTEEVVWGHDAKEIIGKAKVVSDKIVSIENVDNLIPLLSVWKELVKPSRIDWFSLLDKVKAKNEGLYLKAAEHILSEPSFQADIQDYTRLIDIHAKETHLEDAERIRENMIANGMTPNVIVLTSLFHMYTEAGEFVQAKECFEALRSQGFEPDLGVYSSMIMTCVNAGEVKQGEDLLDKMETLDMKPAEEVYMVLLRGYSKCGDVKGAHRIETSMILFAGSQPNLEFYTLLVETYVRNNDVTGARNIIDYMMQSGFKPDDKCIAVMIAAYEKKNELNTALHLLLKLKKEKIELGMSTYCVLVDWCGKLLLVYEAEHFLRKIAQLGEAVPFKIQVSLCDMYSRVQNGKKALEYLGVLEAKKELLEADDFERVIHGLTKGGYMQEASRMRGLMEAQGFTVTESVNFVT